MTEPLRLAFALGIGDCHWALTKVRALRQLHPDRPVHAYVNSSPNHATWGYLACVPFVDRAEYSNDAPYDVWNDLEGTHRDPRWSTLDGCQGWRGFDYVLVPNGHLERGEPLATWLPELETEYSYKLLYESRELERVARLCGQRPVLLYLSGTGPNVGFHNYTWTPNDWRRVITLLNERLDVPVVIVGANTRDDLEYKAEVLNGYNFWYVDLVGKTSIPEYCALIENASVWAGLNSGGGIVSAMRGTPTVMLWSNSDYPIACVDTRVQLHPNMQRSWLAPDQQGTYRTLSFGSPELTPERFVEDILEVRR